MNVSVDNYPNLIMNDEGLITVRNKKVTIQSLIYYSKIGLSKEKLFDYLDITEEELNEVKDFLKNELGVVIYGEGN